MQQTLVHLVQGF